MRTFRKRYVVTPHAGVWIETLYKPHLPGTRLVTPHAGVWIETIGCINTII